MLCGCVRVEFGAYGFLTQSIPSDKHGNGSVIIRILTPECRAQMVTPFILKLRSAGIALVSLYSTEETIFLAVFTANRAWFVFF